MNNKNKIGALVILGGIALFGYNYFKKNKPTIAKVQLKGLEELAKSYESGVAVKEDTKINVDYTIQPIINSFQGILGGSSIFLDPAFTRELQDADRKAKENMALYGTITNPNEVSKFPTLDLELGNLGKPDFKLSEQGMKELDNMNKLLGLDFSNFKI